MKYKFKWYNGFWCSDYMLDGNWVFYQILRQDLKRILLTPRRKLWK